jgi:hypothetical protein
MRSRRDLAVPVEAWILLNIGTTGFLGIDLPKIT